jgi:flagellar basal-body rod protein FlgB
MAGSLDDAFRFSETSLRLRSERQQLLASNIANADTPNYKARDIDFNKALQSAMSSPRADGGLTVTNPNHIAKNSISVADSIAGAPLLYRRPQQGSIDGNTVDMDVERNQFADNAIRYEAGVTLLTSQIRNMLAAIQG